MSPIIHYNRKTVEMLSKTTISCRYMETIDESLEINSNNPAGKNRLPDDFFSMFLLKMGFVPQPNCIKVVL